MTKKIICQLTIILILSFSIISLIPNAKAQTQPTLSLTPSTVPITQLSQTFTLDVSISNVQNLWQWDAAIAWDPTVLTLLNTPQEGAFMTQAGTTMFIAIPPGNGTVSDIDDTLMTSTGASGNGILAILHFQVIGQSATTSVLLDNITLEGPLPAGSTTGTAHPVITPTSTSSTATITFVSGGAPAANAGTDQTVQQGTTVTFDGSGSVSSGSSPAYSWSFMDGGVKKTLTGVAPTYTFSTPGVYVVTLALMDSNGNSTSTVTIKVQSNSKPVAVIAIDGFSQGQSATVGQPITFNGTKSNEANNGTIARYLWDTGDCSSGTNATLTHTYLVPGTFNVTLTVFDATDLNGTACIQLIVAKNPNQTPTPTPSTTTQTQTSSPDPTSTSTPTATPPSNYNPQTSLPTAVLAIVVITTIAVFGGSTVWLRKRT